MMKGLVPIKKLFEPIYGVDLELIKLEVCNKNDVGSIRFISRKEANNGLSAYVKRIEEIIPNPAHTISVATSGSVLSAFYQDEPYYSGRDLYYLAPKKKMTVEELMFYAFCIQSNKYKYNYGRAANRTLKDILIPEEMPVEFKKLSLAAIEIPKAKSITSESIDLKIGKWKLFQLGNLFDIGKGKRLTIEDMEVGNTPFVGAIESNNGYRQFISKPPIHTGDTITVNYNGSVGDAFYQPFPFWPSDDVNVLYPKFEMNIYIALFFTVIIRREKYRFNFGRKWHKERMEESFIKLPAAGNNPDFVFMENYIKSLPYSYKLEEETPIVKRMKSKKSTTPEKGLSDEELIEKYEIGKSKDFNKGMATMINTPAPGSEKRKIKHEK